MTETPGSGMPLAVTVPVTVCWAKSYPIPKAKKDRVVRRFNFFINVSLIIVYSNLKLIKKNKVGV